MKKRISNVMAREYFLRHLILQKKKLYRKKRISNVMVPTGEKLI